jgi:hypothetical protein
METYIERRLAPRVPVRHPIIYSYLPSNAPPMRMIDWSDEGAAVEALDPLPIGAAISFMIVGSNHQVVEVRATVVHVQSVPNFPYRIGVRFSSLTPDGRRILVQSIRHDTA